MLSKSDFNPKYDRLMKGKTYEVWAGGKKYTQPPEGYIGRALNIGGFDQECLRSDKKGWPIVYQGIKGDIDHIIPCIIKQGLRPGWSNSYTVKPAIYCSPTFNTALGYASKDSNSIFSKEKVVI